MANWISVEEKLPEVNEPVLCVGMCSDGDFLAPVVAALQDDGKFIVGYRFDGDRAIGFFIETFVTHWMPSPAPPVTES